MRLRGELPKEEEEEEEDWDPEPILACNYLNDGSGRFMVTSQGPYLGYLYICDFTQQRPLQAIEITKTSLCTLMHTSPSSEFLLLGYDNGEFQIRFNEKLDRSL